MERSSASGLTGGHPHTARLRVLQFCGRGVAMLLIAAWSLLDALVVPFVRPLVGWLAGLPLFAAAGAAIGRLPPYAVLALFAVPFVVIEPLKAVALYVIGIGHVWSGLALLVGAELLSLLVVERIYHAGHDPLMRIGWFRRLVEWIAALRDLALGWLHASRIWRFAQRAKLRAAALLRRIARA